MKARTLSVILPVAATCVFVPRMIWPEAAIFHDTLTPRVLDLASHPVRLGFLLWACLLAWRCAARMEPGAARRAWTLLGGWLVLFSAAEATIGGYHVLRNELPPVPSGADLFFILGYVLLLASLLGFIRAYFASGFPFGRRAEYAAIVAVVGVALALVALRILPPVAARHIPRLELAVSLSYPIFDFVILVPTVVLLRMTALLRGGAVWRTWALLLVSFSFMSVGDILFAYGMDRFESLVDLMETWAYFAAAYGTGVQLEL